MNFISLNLDFISRDTNLWKFGWQTFLFFSFSFSNNLDNYMTWIIEKISLILYYRTEHAKTQNSTSYNASHWNLPVDLTETEFFVSGYTALILGVIITIVSRNTFFAISGYKCAKRVHDGTFKGVIHTNSSFFHNNPSGK